MGILIDWIKKKSHSYTFNQDTMIVYPTWLKGHIKKWNKEKFISIILCSTNGNELLEVWYFGELNKDGKIVDKDNKKCKIIARDPDTGEEFLIFDSAKHGYDSMFCTKYHIQEIENRPLKKLQIPVNALRLELMYNIDYELEKEEYDFDYKGNVKLIDGSKKLWDDIKRDGFDGIRLLSLQGKKNIILLELEELA